MKIERILANNPGPFTGAGTNTWLLDDGGGNVVVIDPGPIDADHAAAITGRLDGRESVGVLVTHTHSDHAPLANPLARELGVAAVGYGAGDGFEPDIRLVDGDRFGVGGLELEVVHTPGHADDHLCFQVGKVVFTGDHIVGGSSVMVEDMGRYLGSLRRLQGLGLERLLPGHGEEMDDPETTIDWYLAHRLQRHEEVCAAVRDGAATTDEVVSAVYSEVEPSLHPLAARSVEAHLILLAEEGRIAFEGGRAVAVP